LLRPKKVQHRFHRGKKMACVMGAALSGTLENDEACDESNFMNVLFGVFPELGTKVRNPVTGQKTGLADAVVDLLTTIHSIPAKRLLIGCA
jgi:hypothetical protein